MPRLINSRAQTKSSSSCAYQFMKTESEEAMYRDPHEFINKAVLATGIPARTLKKVIDEAKLHKQLRERRPFDLPIKEMPGLDTRTCTKLDNLGKGVLKRLIYKFHAAENAMPSMIKLLVKLKQEINYTGSTAYLRGLVKKLGFNRYKTTDQQDYYLEKPNIRMGRMKYLQNIKRYRNEGRPIIFTTVTYIGAPVTGPPRRSCHAPINPYRQGVVLVYAGSAQGLVPKATTIFKNFGQKSNGVVEFDYEYFEEWIRDCLLPNIPENSVVVLRNDPYTKKILNAAPTQRAPKTEMQKWLRDMGIPFEPTMMKPQLSKLIDLNKNTYQSYAIDQILKENNHTVLRLPPYHPDLNPLTLAWETNEDRFGRKPKSNDLKDIVHFVLNNLTSIHNAGNLKTYCDKITEIEDHYSICDSFMDNPSDQMQPDEYDTSDTDSDVDGDIIMTDTDEESE